MKTKSLSNFTQLPNQRIWVPMAPGGGCGSLQVHLLNQTCHFCFRDAESKQETYQMKAEDGVVLVLNCGVESFGYLPGAYVVEDDFTTMDQLLGKLHEILTVGMDGDTRHPLHGNALNTLIVDNISVYFWDLRLLNMDPKNSRVLGYTHEISGHEYYARLLDALHTIQGKYKCNIITTSWDNVYERGYNYNGNTEPDLAGLDSLTYLPASYLQPFDYIIHSRTHDRGISRCMYNQSEARWVPIGSVWPRS